ISTTSVIAQSGIVFLPPNGGSWVNCTTDITTVSYQNISVKTVDFSLPVTAGFGFNLAGNYSYDRIQGIGFEVSSYTENPNIGMTISEMNALASANDTTYYCDTLEFYTTQCDDKFKGFPSPDEADQQWCIA
ncbi:3507_t:CDS:2, partial [Dentiscutata heterogama]